MTSVRTVRDATYDVLRDTGMTTLFANPGSTEVPFLATLPDDFSFVLSLHEGSVVGLATGFAIAAGNPAAVLLHTTAGLGNAVGAIATARVNRAPMVIIVGQQDRRHLALHPFLAGKLEGLAGEYPLEVIAPVRGADVPAAIRRAHHVAAQGSGPVIVIVPMSDWLEPEEIHIRAAALRVVRESRMVPKEVDQIAEALAAARKPVLVVGAGADTEAGWAAVVKLAEHLNARVWIEPFGARAPFPQTHSLYSGQLPADRPRVVKALDGADVVVVVGTAALRQYPWVDGPLFPPSARVMVVTEDEDEANRSFADLGVIADVPAAVSAILAALPTTPQRSDSVQIASVAEPHRLDLPEPGEQMRAAHVFELLAQYLPHDTVIIEESPSSRPALQALLPARQPLSFLSAAMGGLGFAMPAAIGLKMANPGRPVLAVVGDGSSMYSIQSLWSAAEQSVGVVFVVLSNGGYAIMDRLAEQQGGSPAWPPFPEVSVSALALGFGVDAERIEDYESLRERLSGICPGLAGRSTPLLLEVVVRADPTFAP